MTGSCGLRISYQRTPATPGRASTDWFVTSDSYALKLRYWSRKVGRCRYERMSRYWSGLTMPGCGRQSRGPGAHGKFESNSAVGIDSVRSKVELAGCAKSTSAANQLIASNGAP